MERKIINIEMMILLITILLQDTEVGRKIMRVSATDVDEGDNQKITYELRAEKYPADIEYFRWDEKTGEVWLSKKLDKPVSSVFVLKVSCWCQVQSGQHYT